MDRFFDQSAYGVSVDDESITAITYTKSLTFSSPFLKSLSKESPFPATSSAIFFAKE